ncbi:TSUP family transporter, partial [Isoptericola sp. QY 916]|nr:TSUP family transporter [Isoptericola sp. QY 916]
MLLLLVLAILVGGALQRVTGMGFGLVAGPFIVLLVGPLEGVLFVNLAGAIASALILGRVARDVDWRRYAWLAVTSVVVMVPAALLLRDASRAALEVAVGALVVVAMTLAVVTTRLRRGGRHPVRPEAR